MHLGLRLLAALTAWILLSGNANAACNITIGEVTSTSWEGASGRGYEVYDPQRRIQLVGFRVRSHDGGCPFYVTVSPTMGPGDGTGYLSGTGGGLAFGLYKDASGSQALRPAGLAVEADMYIGVVPAGGSIFQQFMLIIPPEQVVATGFYAADIEFTLHEGVLGSGVVRDRRRVTASAQVLSVAQVSFAEGTGFDPNHSSQSVQFGQLKAGDRKVVHLKARSNGGYRLLLQSVNGGALRHVNPTDDSRIPYSVLVDGNPIRLDAGETMVIMNSEITNSSGRNHRLEFVIDTIGDASAGDYADLVNVSIWNLR